MSSNTASNVAAMAAAVREAGDTSLGMPISNRRDTMSKTASARSGAPGGLPSPPASLPSHRMRLTSTGKLDHGESAIDDEQHDDDMDEEEETGFKQSRMRRASEGQHLIKDGKKANGGDLKCDKCGKGYKHSSCLSKHLFVPTFLSAYSIWAHAVNSLEEQLLTMIADGSIHLNGHTLRSCSFLSINKCNCWKRLLSL